MADLIRDAMSWLGGMMKDHATVSVVFSSGGQSVTVDATMGPSEIPLDDGQVAVLSSEFRDFAVTAADLILSGVVVEPQRADTIAVVIQGITYTYAVTLQANTEAWEWADSSQVRRIIHTKLSNSEAP